MHDEVPKSGFPVVMPDYGSELYYYAGYNALKDAGVVFFKCCPARLITRFTRNMVRWFFWIDAWGKDPFNYDRDLTLETLDERFYRSMEILKREQRRVEQEDLDKARENRNQEEAN